MHSHRAGMHKGVPRKPQVPVAARGPTSHQLAVLPKVPQIQAPAHALLLWHSQGARSQFPKHPAEQQHLWAERGSPWGDQPSWARSWSVFGSSVPKSVSGFSRSEDLEEGDPVGRGDLCGAGMEAASRGAPRAPWMWCKCQRGAWGGRHGASLLGVLTPTRLQGAGNGPQLRDWEHCPLLVTTARGQGCPTQLPGEDPAAASPVGAGREQNQAAKHPTSGLQ